MKLFQTLIFVAVLFSNIHWQWTPNGYVASLIGFGVKFFVTYALVLLKEALQWLFGRGKCRAAPARRPPPLPTARASRRMARYPARPATRVDFPNRLGRDAT